MRIQTLVLSMILSAAAFAGDVTGKWVAQQPGRDGATREVTMTFKADGAKLSGEVSGGQGGGVAIQDGKVDGDNISFTVKREFNGNTMVMSYTGKLSGDELKLSMKREGGDQPAREMTAKRAK